MTSYNYQTAVPRICILFDFIGTYILPETNQVWIIDKAIKYMYMGKE